MLEALGKIFQTVARNFYKDSITVTITDDNDTAKADAQDNIYLPAPLLEQFSQWKLPRFTVFYHELGHTLYSSGLHKLIERWTQIPSRLQQYSYDNKYHHLLNWLEDFHIERQLESDYPYLQDILSCLKKIQYNYDITAIDKAFNHFYIKGYATPALNNSDAMTFRNYITTLLTLRAFPTFGNGAISLLSTQSKETQFIKTFIDFYKWCVGKQILDDIYLPPLSMPTNIISTGGQSNGNAPSSNTPTGQSDRGSNVSDHTHLVGFAKEEFPDIDASSTAIFVKQFTSEEKLIKEELANRSRVDSQHESLDGLFNNLFKDTSIIQSKIIVKNFFNPNRLLDQVLFKTPTKSFNNVSIYRDISGSTHGSLFSLINKVCKYLNDKIPIAKHFYLYASGSVSIMETTFEDWEDYTNIPDAYKYDPVFTQLGSGTNSDAIADVITEQLNDKWLNIIVTDGDLNALFNRPGIESLLKNIFIISIEDDVKSNLIDESRYIFIKDESDINKIANAMINMKGEN